MLPAVAVILALLALPALAQSERAMPSERPDRSVWLAQTSRSQPEPWCQAITRSSFVNGICYDERRRLMSLKLNSQWYEYCNVAPGLVQQLVSAPSIGRYFHAEIRGRYEC
jgi:hypothetical protein